MKSVLRIVLISTSRFLYIAYFVYFTVCIFSLLSVCLTTSLAIPLILILSFYPFSNELLSINSSPSLCCSKTTIPLFTKLKYQFLDYPLKFNVLFSFGEVILTFFFSLSSFTVKFLQQCQAYHEHITHRVEPGPPSSFSPLASPCEQTIGTFTCHWQGNHLRRPDCTSCCQE